jgi:DNA polymerase sigma
MENILDPVRKELSVDIWNGMSINPGFRKNILNSIKSKLDMKEIKDIIFIGSMTGYQYNESSDIDIHIRIDGKTQKELNEYWDLLPSGINYEGTTHPINFFFYSGSEFEGKGGKGSAYDLLGNKWIIEPEKEDVNISYDYIMEIAKIFMSGIDDKVREYKLDRHEKDYWEKAKKDVEETEQKEIEARIDRKKFEIEADLDALYLFKEVLFEMRTGSYTGEELDLFVKMGKGNKSIQNAVYKILETTGYKDILSEYGKIKKDLK